MQCIAKKLNVANKKYVIFSIYRLPRQNINYFLNSISEALDFYLKHYENIFILGDFNATLSNPHLTLFLENKNLKSIIENPTCFKSSNGSANDLILSIKKLNFLKKGLVITTIQIAQC